MIIVEKGHTIRFEIQFKDYDGSNITPDNISFKVYDRRFTELSSNELTEANSFRNEDGSIKVGNYFYDYVANQIGEQYIEFVGYIDNKPTLKREKITVVFDS